MLTLDGSILDTYFWKSEFGRPGAGTPLNLNPDAHLSSIIYLISIIYLCEYSFEKFRIVFKLDRVPS